MKTHHRLTNPIDFATGLSVIENVFGRHHTIESAVALFVLRPAALDEIRSWLSSAPTATRHSFFARVYTEILMRNLPLLGEQRRFLISHTDCDLLPLGGDSGPVILDTPDAMPFTANTPPAGSAQPSFAESEFSDDVDPSQRETRECVLPITVWTGDESRGVPD